MLFKIFIMVLAIFGLMTIKFENPIMIFLSVFLIWSATCILTGKVEFGLLVLIITLSCDGLKTYFKSINKRDV